MTEEMFRLILDSAQVKTDKEGWAVMPEGRHLTLYASHAGVSLTIGKVEKLRTQQSVVRARNVKGETYFIALNDLFAAAVDGQDAAAGRKPGFLGA